MTEDGIAASALSIGRSQFQEARKIRAWVRDPDGTVTSYDEDDGTLLGNWSAWTLDDNTTLTLRLPDVRPGSTIYVSYRFRSTPDLPQDLFSLQWDVPVALARVELTAEKGARVRARVGGGPNPGPGEVTDRGTWEFRDLPGLGTGEDDDEAPRGASRRLVLDYAAGTGAVRSRTGAPSPAGSPRSTSRRPARPASSTRPRSRSRRREATRSRRR